MTSDKPNGFKDGKGRFTKGNPGKPRGARSQTTLAIESLLGKEATKLTRKAIKSALDGDGTALKLCMERIAPVRRGRVVTVESFPKVSSAADVPGALSALLQAVAKGELTTDEAESIASLCSRYVNALEAVEHEARLKALEDKLK
jgi:predicted GNAT family acetyltransferase